MFKFDIKKTVTWNGSITKKMRSAMKVFGLTEQKLNKRKLLSVDGTKMTLIPGDICFVKGISGSGKSSLLDELRSNVPDDQSLDLTSIPLEQGKSVIDCIDADFFESLKILSKAGLSDAFAILNEPVNLSDGQKFRYRLAKAILAETQIVFVDDYCSGLDRISAAVISHNLRKIAKNTGKIFILASCHDDMLRDLLPDIIVQIYSHRQNEIVYREKRRKVS